FPASSAAGSPALPRRGLPVPTAPARRRARRARPPVARTRLRGPAETEASTGTVEGHAPTFRPRDGEAAGDTSRTTSLTRSPDRNPNARGRPRQPGQLS